MAPRVSAAAAVAAALSLSLCLCLPNVASIAAAPGQQAATAGGGAAAAAAPAPPKFNGLCYASWATVGADSFDSSSSDASIGLAAQSGTGPVGPLWEGGGSAVARTRRCRPTGWTAGAPGLVGGL